MHFSFLAILAALASSAVAQNVTFAQFIAELQDLGFTTFANLTFSTNGTSTASQIQQALASNNVTVFVPSNAAFLDAPNLTQNWVAADVVSYHILPGTFNFTPSFPNDTVGRTLLNESSLVFLEDSLHQALAWTNYSGTIQVMNQNVTNSSAPPTVVSNSSLVGSITYNEINSVLKWPIDLQSTLAGNNLTNFSAALQNTSLFSTYNFTHGITIFAPSNAAFSNASSNLTAFGSNSTSLTQLLQNHAILGETLYSPELVSLSGTNVTSAAGQGISIAHNASGVFVTNGNKTARIIQPDVLIWNGVVHVIDSVLLTNASNPSAASSAISTASARAASLSSKNPVGPIGPTLTPTAPFSMPSVISTTTGAGAPGVIPVPPSTVGVTVPPTISATLSSSSAPGCPFSSASSSLSPSSSSLFSSSANSTSSSTSSSST